MPRIEFHSKVSGDTDSAQLMAGGASEAAGYPGDKGLFLTKNSNVRVSRRERTPTRLLYD